MHITQETDYAVRIVYCLARCGVRRDARSISEEMSVTLRFSLKILGKLVASGLVASYKGNRGGYELARPASDITLKNVLDAMEGPYRLCRCVGEGECNRGASGRCTFQRVFSDISENINQQLAGVTFAKLLASESDGSCCTPVQEDKA